MAKKKTDNLSSFENAMNEFGFNNPYEQPSSTDVTNILDNDDIDNLDNNINTPGDIDVNPEENNNGQDPHTDDSNIPDHVLNNGTSNTGQEGLGEQNTLNNDDQNIDPNESNNISMFFDAFAEELGWDVDDEDKPNSVSDLVDYIDNLIKENSTPQYSDERIAQLDAYVKNGGNFEDFYQRQQEQVSYDNMDMEDESNQRAVVRDYLRYQGYTDDQINRKIERYEDGDLLEEEAEDAVARLKQIREQQIAIQQQQQEAARQAQEEQARQFMENLTGSINSLDNIRGIAIPKQDRKALFDYITKVDADGLTQYQKDFNENLVNNLIESAYFTMKGDTLLNEATRSGRTSAANKLRTMLRHTNTNHSRYGVNDDKQRSVVEIASQFYN